MSKSQYASPQAFTLMYHRINNIDTDPWNICVSPYYFEEHVQFLKNNFNIINSAELCKQITSNTIKQNNLCITFDDGYADNYINAKYVLEKYDCPATFFIPTAFINQTKNFWWDELEIIFLHSRKLPSSLCLNITGKNYKYNIVEIQLSDEQYQQHITWKWYDEAPTSRCKIFLNLWKKLRPLLLHEIEDKLSEIKKWAGLNEDTYNRLSMNEYQLYELTKNNLFSIGLHTHSHIDLKGKEINTQLDEILISKKILKEKYNIESNYLAYPYGSYDEETIRIVEQLKLTGCFTTDAIANNANTDLSRIGRYQVCNWNIEEFKSYLNDWCMNCDNS